MKCAPSHHTGFAKWILAFENPGAVPCLTAEFSEETEKKKTADETEGERMHYQKTKRDIKALRLLQEAGASNSIAFDDTTLTIDVKGLENCARLGLWLKEVNRPLYNEELRPQGMEDVEWLAAKEEASKRPGSRTHPRTGGNKGGPSSGRSGK